MDLKSLIESLIVDVAYDEKMQKISSKAHIISSLLDNAKFKVWVNNELVKGYVNYADLPDYRKLKAMNIIASYIAPNGYGVGHYTDVPVPIENLGKEISDLIYSVIIFDALPILEKTIITGDNVCYSLNSNEKYFVQKVLGRAQIMSVYKQLSLQDFINVSETVRHQLLEFLLVFNKTLFNNNIHFDLMDRKEKDKRINNIYASIVHTGTGYINANASQNTVTGNIAAGNDQWKYDVEKLLVEIESVNLCKDEKEEIKQCIADIRYELSLESPSIKVIRKTLRALKSFGSIVMEKIVETGIDRIINILPV